MDAWLGNLKSAQKTQLIQDGKRKVHYTFDSGQEMAEEYDVKTNVLLVRKWRRKQGVMGKERWEFEVGEDSLPQNLEAEGLMVSASNPIFVRKDTLKAFVWRIRNLPYPIETYDVKVSEDNSKIVVKTTNKKYFKKYSVEDMERCGLKLSQDSISLAHANNTLLITYKKPQEILQLEQQVQAEFHKSKAIKEGDVGCTPS